MSGARLVKVTLLIVALFCIGGGWYLHQEKNQERAYGETAEAEQRAIQARRSVMESACSKAILAIVPDKKFTELTSFIGERGSGNTFSQARFDFYERWRIGSGYKLPFEVNERGSKNVVACFVLASGDVERIENWTGFDEVSAGNRYAWPDKL